MWRKKAIALEAKVNRAIDARKVWMAQEEEMKQVRRIPNWQSAAL